jgi:CheY-like chemotaxis protein
VERIRQRKEACQRAASGIYCRGSMTEPSDKPLIYVVDDEPLLLELATALLEPAGYAVKTFPDGDVALQAFASAKSRPALIITDYAMHRMTGLDLIRECRQIHPKQRIIMVSGTVDENIYANSRHKPDRFLPKPYQSKQLISAVEALLKD